MAISSSFSARLARGDFDTEGPGATGRRHARATAPELVEQVEAALGASRGRIVKLTSDGETVWVKRPRRGPGYTLYGLHFGAAPLLGICLFRPPRVSRGSSGLAAEASGSRICGARAGPSRASSALRRAGWR